MAGSGMDPMASPVGAGSAPQVHILPSVDSHRATVDRIGPLLP